MRRLILLLGVLSATVILAACGGSSGPSSTSTAPNLFAGQATSTPAAAETTPAVTNAEGGSPTPPTGAGTSSTATIPGLHTIAAATQNEGSTVVSEQYQLGPINDGTDASAAAQAMSSCDQFTNANPPTNAYAEGVLTIRYSKGSLPLPVTLSLDHVYEDIQVYDGEAPEGTIGVMSVSEGDGTWDCGGMDDENEIDYTLQPGSVSTMPFWLIVPQVLSNARPTMQQIDVDGLIFHPGFEINNQLPPDYKPADRRSTTVGRAYPMWFCRLPRERPWRLPRGRAKAAAERRSSLTA